MTPETGGNRENRRLVKVDQGFVFTFSSLILTRVSQSSVSCIDRLIPCRSASLNIDALDLEGQLQLLLAHRILGRRILTKTCWCILSLVFPGSTHMPPV
jgi:hypothetical protein